MMDLLKRASRGVLTKSDKVNLDAMLQETGGLEKADDGVSTLAREVQALRKQIDAMPVAAKGVVAVTKGYDAQGGGDSLDQVAESLSKMGPEDRAMAMIKMAQQHPVPVTPYAR
jgi:hypothetical protein